MRWHAWILTCAGLLAMGCSSEEEDTYCVDLTSSCSESDRLSAEAECERALRNVDCGALARKYYNCVTSVANECVGGLVRSSNFECSAQYDEYQACNP